MPIQQKSKYSLIFDAEAKEQVTANLANFAYDPINFKFLKAAECIPLFLELLASPNSTLVLHGIAALCNICLGNLPAHSRWEDWP